MTEIAGMAERAILGGVAVVFSVVLLVASPIIAYREYQRTRGRWPRAKRIWIATGIALACGGGSFLCFGLVSLVPLSVAEVLLLGGVILLVLGTLAVSVAAYYRWLDQLLEGS